MLEIMPGLPDNVLGVKAVGEVDDDDYEDVLEPALNDYLSRHDKIRFLYYLGPEFTGYEADAMWEDTKLGFRTFTKYERLAVVTDTTWVKRCVKAFGWMMPGHVKIFDVAELDAATRWTSES